MRWDKDGDVLLMALWEGIDKNITDLSVWNKGQPDKFTKNLVEYCRSAAGRGMKTSISWTGKPPGPWMPGCGFPQWKTQPEAANPPPLRRRNGPPPLKRADRGHAGLAPWCHKSNGPEARAFIRPLQGRGTSRKAGGGLAAAAAFLFPGKRQPRLPAFDQRTVTSNKK